MTTLVTGGNGWVPSHIVRRLARRGETVVSYDLMEPDALLLEMLAEVGDVISAYGASCSSDSRSRHPLRGLISPACVRNVSPCCDRWSASMCAATASSGVFRALKVQFQAYDLVCVFPLSNVGSRRMPK